MGNPSLLGQVAYEEETVFCEDVTTFGTANFPLCGPVDVSGLKHDKIDAQRTVQYRGDNTQWIPGIQGGTVKTKMYLPGHGSTAAGAVTAGILETILKYVIGNVTAGADGTTFTGGTASVPVTTSSATFADGSLVRGGSLGDGGCNGQFLAVGTHTLTALHLLTDADAAPSNTNVCYTSVMNFPSSSPTATNVTGIRMLFQTANVQYECHGCVATDYSFSPFKAGTIPYIEVTWTVSAFRYSAATFPNAAASEAFQPAPIAAGSIFVNTVGTSTRAKRVARDLTFTVKPNVVMQLGHGGAFPYQQYVGAKRGIPDVRVSWTEDADATTTSPVLPGYGTGANAKHILASLSSANGSALALYIRNAKIINIPTQMNDGGFNRFRIEAQAGIGPNTATELTRAPFVLASA